MVFSDQTMVNFRAADADSFARITAALAHWDDIDVHVRDRVITSSGHGFSGIARKKLLEILQGRCEEVGVSLRFQAEVRDEAGLARHGLADADVIVAADGVNSAWRAGHAGQFGPDLDTRSAKYIWLGTSLPLDAFTFYFVENAHGVFQAHCYRFDADTSTFIVECDEASWTPRRLRPPRPAADGRGLRALFGRWLDGHRLGRTRRRPRRRGPASCGCATAPGSTTGWCSSATPRTPPISRSARAPSWPWRTPSRWRGCWPARSRWPRRSASTSRSG